MSLSSMSSQGGGTHPTEWRVDAQDGHIGFELKQESNGKWNIRREGVDKEFQVFQVQVTRGENTVDYLEELAERCGNDHELLRQEMFKIAAHTVAVFQAAQKSLGTIQATGRIMTEFAGDLLDDSFRAKKMIADFHGEGPKELSKANLVEVSETVSSFLKHFTFEAKKIGVDLERKESFKQSSESNVVETSEEINSFLKDFTMPHLPATTRTTEEDDSRREAILHASIGSGPFMGPRSADVLDKKSLNKELSRADREHLDIESDVSKPDLSKDESVGLLQSVTSEVPIVPLEESVDEGVAKKSILWSSGVAPSTTRTFSGTESFLRRFSGSAVGLDQSPQASLSAPSTSSSTDTVPSTASVAEASPSTTASEPANPRELVAGNLERAQTLLNVGIFLINQALAYPHTPARMSKIVDLIASAFGSISDALNSANRSYLEAGSTEKSQEAQLKSIERFTRIVDFQVESMRALTEKEEIKSLFAEETDVKQPKNTPSEKLQKVLRDLEQLKGSVESLQNKVSNNTVNTERHINDSIHTTLALIRAFFNDHI